MTPEVYRRFQAMWWYCLIVPAILFSVAAHVSVPFIATICYVIYGVGLLIVNARVESQIGGN